MLTNCHKYSLNFSLILMFYFYLLIYYYLGNDIDHQHFKKIF